MITILRVAGIAMIITSTLSVVFAVIGFIKECRDNGLIAGKRGRRMKDGDLISRQAVLDLFGDIHPLDYNSRAYVKQIEELPTIPQKTEERPNAKWIWKESLGVDYCHCSKCHDGMWEMEFDYCPYCGAKMRGEE